MLHGRRALVCAIDQRMTVEVFQCLENVLRIESDLGTYESPLDQLEDHPDFRFVLDAVRQYPLEQGIDLKITSDFASDIGFGSSAAVTVATHAALMNFPRSRTSATKDCRAGAETPLFNKMDLFKRCLATVHRVQGRGSGSDLAASVFGGVVAYRAEPLEIHPIAESFPLTAVYSGSKMKTADVIRYLEEKRALNPEYFEKIFDRMDASVGEVIEDFPSLGSERSEKGRANARQGLKVLAKNLILNQKLMEEMGLCNAALAEIISIFQTLETPAKISGSGLGDCAIGLGNVPNIGNYKKYALRVTTQGVRAE